MPFEPRKRQTGAEKLFPPSVDLPISRSLYSVEQEKDPEEKVLTFALQEDIKGLRVYIEGANLDWGGYTIKDIGIYKVAETPVVISQTGDNTPVVQMAVALAISLVSIVALAVCAKGKKRTKDTI